MEVSTTMAFVGCAEDASGYGDRQDAHRANRFRTKPRTFGMGIAFPAPWPFIYSTPRWPSLRARRGKTTLLYYKKRDRTDFSSKKAS